MKHVGVTADPKDIATQEQLGSMTPSLDLDDVSGLVPALAAKEPAIAAGTASQFWRGDKTWQDFAVAVRSAVLTGLSTATSTVVAAADSVLVAIGKLQAQVSLRAPLASPALTGMPTTPTQATTDNSSQVVNSRWVRNSMLNIATATGFQFSTGLSGYLKLPVWLGGTIFQWTRVLSTDNLGLGYTQTSWPITYPTACILGVVSAHTASTKSYTMGAINVVTTSPASVDWIAYNGTAIESRGAGWIEVTLFSIGY